MKKCPKCGKTKNISEFCNNTSWCKQCYRDDTPDNEERQMIKQSINTEELFYKVWRTI